MFYKPFFYSQLGSKYNNKTYKLAKHKKTMEDDQIYNAIIISLIIGIVIVIVTLVIARPEPESFTELYFNDHQNLPKYSQDSYNFSFTIHNLENKDINYKYQVLVDDKIALFNTIEIKDKENITIPVSIKIDKDFKKAKIQVLLPEKQQEIHFWVKYNEHLLMDYDGFDAAVECLPVHKANYNDFVVIKARPNYADGWPILEIRENGAITSKITINRYNIYTVYGPVTKDVIIDLNFINDYNIDGKDRNIYIEYMKIGDKEVDLLYDVGKNEQAFDCENLKDNGNMAWNGAIRFKIKW